MKIALEKIKVHDAFKIAIRFPYNYTAKEYLKELKGVYWSNTYKTFYIDYSEEHFKQLYEHLRIKEWLIDYSQIKFDETASASEKIQLKVPEKITHHQQLIKTFGDWMRQKRYSESTINTYSSMLDLFFRYHTEKLIEDITETDIVLFNQHYILRNNYSATFQNQLINAIKLFYQKYNNTHLRLDKLERPKKSKKLPEVMSMEEVAALLNSIKNIKHKALLSLVYAGGLRIGEALSLQLKDIDSKRLMLHLKNAKGKKDRYVPLSVKILALIRTYFMAYKPKIYLFEGAKGGEYDPSSARAIFHKAVAAAGIHKNVTLHTLRHSYATHLLESGTDIRLIQELLGHNDPKTTMIYTHVSTSSLQKIENPFDKLNII
ncbi:MAG: site-specific integrase [Flavobacteriaceae bacterium]|nr:site-specific integrase [Flavobacteriaceae bacterium]